MERRGCTRFFCCCRYQKTYDPVAPVELASPATHDSPGGSSTGPATTALLSTEQTHRTVPNNSLRADGTDIYITTDFLENCVDTFVSKCDCENPAESEWEYGSNGDPEYLEFAKGEQFIVLDKSDSKRWKMKSVSTKTEGYAAPNMMEEVTELYHEAWFAPAVSREDAEHVLMNNESIIGEFLIRKSETDGGCYTLSVRTPDEMGKRIVTHCRIKIQDGQFYISPTKKFENLKELVRFYAGHSEDIGTELKRACLTGVAMQPTMNAAAIKRSSLTFDVKIGTANTSEVFKGTWNHTVQVAIKRELRVTPPGAFMREARVRLRLDHHNNIMKFYGVVTQPPMCIVTEYLAENLQNFLRTNDTSQDQHAFWISQILGGMSFMESQRCIHRNLRCANVLVGPSEICCKISGFAFARFEEDEDQTDDRPLSLAKWAAPEALAFNKYSTKSDVWSFGIVVIEIATKGAEPYIGVPEQEIGRMVHDGYKMPKPVECPQDWYDIIERCWEKEPELRPSFAYLKENWIR